MDSPMAYAPQRQQSPYMDAPLLQPQRGGRGYQDAYGPRQGSVSSFAPGAGGDSAWQSTASLADDRGLMQNDQYPRQQQYQQQQYQAPYPRYDDDYGRYTDQGASRYNEQGRYNDQGGYGAAGYESKAYRDDNDYPPYPKAATSGAGGSPYYVPGIAPKKRSKRWIWISILAIIVLGAAGFAVYWFAIRKNPAAASSNGSGPGSGSTNTGSGKGNILISGGAGSMVTTFDGNQTFMYNNTFGGYWYYDPANPYTAGGKCNSWTPASNETWTFGTDIINGVNLGGWLVLEPFIIPALYQKYTPTPVDEWTLSTAMIADTGPGGGIQQIQTHYETFITEIDFAQIAAAGLNWVRIPFPFWALSTLNDEPFLEGVAWTYFLKALQWARKYGLRINLDLHTIPGSQNGWNHSGRLGQVNWLNGAMGLANAQRALDYTRLIAEFVSQPEYVHIVQMFGIVNEPGVPPTGPIVLPDLKRYYYNAYEIIRNITGLGNGHGPMISFFHGFAQVEADWQGWLPMADRIMLDHHPYVIFGGAQSDAPPATFGGSPCSSWGPYINDTFKQFGMIGAGEFSAAINDCGLWVHQVGVNASYAAQFGSCDVWLEYENWNATTKEGLMTFVKAQMESLQNWFFWTWKIAPDQTGTITAPFWSYSLGWANGWIPPNPTQVQGTCASLNVPLNDPFDGEFQPWQTGGPGGVLNPATTEDYSWPPPTIIPSLPLAQLPTYTATGAITTPSAPSGVSGWTDPQDTGGLFVPIAGCQYPEAWLAASVVPTPCPTT